MQQHSGFENRFIDSYHCVNNITSENAMEHSFYAPVFKPNDTISLIVFPGMKAVPFSSAYSEGSALPSVNITLSIALFIAVILFAFLKNTLKSSVRSIFLIGLFPKWLQETERRQIERNMLIINSINATAFFSMSLVIYTLLVRFEFLFISFELLNMSGNFLYSALFFSVVGIVIGLFYTRNGFIAFLGNIFSVSKAMKEYQKPYKLLFVSISPVLLLIAIFLAFAPCFLTSFISTHLHYFVIACYLIFIIISLLKFLNFTNRYTLHIFLYLCTLEILPLFVLVKMIQNVCF